MCYNFIKIIPNNRDNNIQVLTKADLLAWDLSTEVVGAHANVGGVGNSSRGVGHSVSDNVVGGGDTSVGKDGSSISGVGSKTVRVGTEGTVSIGVVEDGGIGLSPGISGPLSVVSVSVWVSVAIAVGSVSVWSSISVISIVSISIGLWFSISGPLAVVVGSIWVSVIGVRGSGTWDGDTGGIHAGGGLASKSVGTIGVWSKVWGIVGVSISVS